MYLEGRKEVDGSSRNPDDGRRRPGSMKPYSCAIGRASESGELEAGAALSGQGAEKRQGGRCTSVVCVVCVVVVVVVLVVYRRVCDGIKWK